MIETFYHERPTVVSTMYDPTVGIFEHIDTMYSFNID